MPPASPVFSTNASTAPLRVCAVLCFLRVVLLFSLASGGRRHRVAPAAGPFAQNPKKTLEENNNFWKELISENKKRKGLVSNVTLSSLQEFIVGPSQSYRKKGPQSNFHCLLSYPGASNYVKLYWLSLSIAHVQPMYSFFLIWSGAGSRRFPDGSGRVRLALRCVALRCGAVASLGGGCTTLSYWATASHSSASRSHHHARQSHTSDDATAPPYLPPRNHRMPPPHLNSHPPDNPLT